MRIIIVCMLMVVAGSVIAQPLKDKIELDYVYPKTYQIEEIKVEGIEFLDPQTIISITHLKVGDKIDIPGEKITKALENIWNQKLVGDVAIYADKVIDDRIYLKIVLQERPRLSKLQFAGLKKTEQKDLEESLGLKRSQVISKALKKNILYEVDSYFKEKGFYKCKSTVKEADDSLLLNHHRLIVSVDKGPKVKISDIKLSGNEKVEDKFVYKKMKKTKEKKLYRFWSRSKFIDEEFKNDKQTVIDYYHSLGMRDAKIVSEKLVEDPENPKEVVLEIEIDEGTVYYFRNITWSGNYIHNDRKLNRILGIKKGDIYNERLLNERLNFNPTGPDVSSLYLNNGYLFFSVNPVEVRVENDSIDLEMRMHEGDVAIIGENRVEGNTKTNDHVILREIRTIPGERFSRADIIRTQRELAQLGYFDPEQIGIVPIPNPQNGTVDIEYTVVEKPSDQLQLSGGWGGAVRFVGTLGVAFNNFSIRNITKFNTWSPLPTGDGQRLSVRAQSSGPRYRSFSASVTEPWLGGRKPNSFTLSASISRISDLDNSFNERGFLKVATYTMMLGKRLTWPDDFFTWTNSISYSRYTIDNYQVSQQTLCETCDLANKFAFNTTIARNNSGDNPQFLTRGANVSLSATFTPPFSLINRDLPEAPDAQRLRNIEFHKWMFDYSRFIQLTGNRKNDLSGDAEKKSKRHFVLNTRAHLGFIGRYNKRMAIGPYERFSLGGDGLSGFNFVLGTDVIGLRGYDNESLGLRDAGQGGGVLFNKFVMELRYPIITEGVATIFVLSFLEAGNNWLTFDEFNPFNLYRSAGVGARIFMPAFGMIGIDYGKGFDEVPGNLAANDGKFHFSIGQQIR